MSLDAVVVLLRAGMFLLAMPLLLICIMLYRHIRLRLALTDFPGPVPSFYFGNVKMMFDENGERMPMLYVQKDLQKKYGDLVKFSVGSNPMVEIYAGHEFRLPSTSMNWSISHAKHPRGLEISDVFFKDAQTMREVMSGAFHTFRNRPYFIIPLVGKRHDSFREALLFTSSQNWASVRAASMPLFHTAALNAAAADVDRHMRTACDAVAAAAAAAAAAAGGEVASAPIDVLKIVQQATLAVAFKVSFGTDIPTGAGTGGSGAQHELAAAARAFFDSMKVSGGLSLFAANLPVALRPFLCRVSYWVSAHSAPLNRSLDVIFAATQQMVEAFAAAHPELDIDAPADPDILQKGLGRKVLDEGAVPSEHSLIAHMLRSHNKGSGKVFTPLETLPQAWIMLVAGYETTAVTIAQTLFCVARNPEVEAALLREIDGHSADSVPSQDTIGEWPYTLACVREALRLYPITLPVRIAGKDTTIAGKRVPAGTSVHIATYAMHTDPRIWPDPYEFRPQRFVDGLSAEAEAVYHPFGVGPRSCIGYRMGLLEATIAVVLLQRRFLFRASDAHHPGGHIRFRMNITMTPVDGIWLSAVPR